ncbi:hypothetical protein AND_004123 [Anopheles darlingi]|uniref:Uncharacterized protein n=1 Tax=Anopheles darlingi TaxID=43151 RepID=W5JIC6_ANODA|nr:uncharacterized protein LOC125959794 [Anopheles darlingi]ETN64142.1 hypothetical protein AND_004123 [Anopheles darlingi]
MRMLKNTMDHRKECTHCNTHQDNPSERRFLEYLQNTTRETAATQFITTSPANSIEIERISTRAEKSSFLNPSGQIFSVVGRMISALVSCLATLQHQHQHQHQHQAASGKPAAFETTMVEQVRKPNRVNRPKSSVHPSVVGV